MQRVFARCFVHVCSLPTVCARKQSMNKRLCVCVPPKPSSRSLDPQNLRIKSQLPSKKTKSQKQHFSQSFLFVFLSWTSPEYEIYQVMLHFETCVTLRGVGAWLWLLLNIGSFTYHYRFRNTVPKGWCVQLSILACPQFLYTSQIMPPNNIL